jgi:hypothetical protein
MAPWFLAEQECHNRLFSLNFFSDGLSGNCSWIECMSEGAVSGLGLSGISAYGTEFGC